MSCEKAIFEKILKMIHSNGAIDASNLKLKLVGSNAILEGTVPEMRMKFLLEDIVATHPAVQIIRNLLKIQ